ncbi:MFS transporter [Burkholderia plantarii]|uniref:Major facilitator superfamily MFS-1 transporter n=1 Tax=Burkholderia plantarii TaxID=41899 RepID=A0A0B6RZ16_BURPL|nr:MFS transporter [Burkholderia plantarii]AJK50612.1 major facilitator superfamily MFS-1 transporter [Burkholderia plantarii]ALK34785.1 MFS transporter, DHA1 family [Burkholderia plantarii]WLE63806.1 MFS transporter [Burkholderia plantarii]
MDRRLLVLALGMFALGTDSFVVAGILPQLSRAFGVGIGAAGQMTTVYAVSYALLAPTLAAVAAAVPRRRLMLGGLGVFVVANLATAFAPSLGIALLARAFAGLGAAMFSPTATGAATMLVPPERRGFALSIVVAGLTAATALGSPLGAVIGGLGNWRWTLGFVAALGALAALGVHALLPAMPLPPAVSLRQRLAPLADARIGLTLATTLLAMAGLFTMYTYFAVVFDRATGGDTAVLGVLLVIWGVAGTASNLLAGRLIDRIGSRRVLVTMLSLLAIDIALMPWSGAQVWSAALAIAIWGASGWGLLVPQQHRLVTLAPSIAPVVVGLNTAATYLGVSAAGLIGAAALPAVGAHRLGFVAAVLLVAALGVAELAARHIRAAARRQGTASAVVA